MSIFLAAPLHRLRFALPACVLACAQVSACANPAPSGGPEAPYRLAPGLAVCFCPSSHKTAALFTRAQLDAMLASAPCTSRGDGAEERARDWSGRCLQAVAEAGLDFEKEAVVYVARYFPSGSITGSLEVSGLKEGVLTLEVRRHESPPPWTPDLGFWKAVLVVDKGRVRRISTDDGWGKPLLLDIGNPLQP